MDGEKALGGRRRFEALHLPLASSYHLVGVLRPVVLAKALLMASAKPEMAACSPVGAKPVGDEQAHQTWAGTLGSLAKGMEQPDAINAAILAFLNGQSAGSEFHSARWGNCAPSPRWRRAAPLDRSWSQFLPKQIDHRRRMESLGWPQPRNVCRSAGHRHGVTCEILPMLNSRTLVLIESLLPSRSFVPK
jgi:hypothetical protein